MDQNQTIAIIPENIEQITAQKKQSSSRWTLLLAALLFFGGIGSYGWWLYQDMKFVGDGTNTTGRVTSSTTQSTSRKGKTYTTNTINYTYETEQGTKQQGRDSVKTWRHRPNSDAALRPKNNDELVVEYLKSSPQASRIVIPNRYGDEYLFSILALISGGGLLLIRFINSQKTRIRLQAYGGLLILLGLALLAVFIYPFFKSEQPVLRPGDSWLIGLALLTLSTFVVAPIWFGWFLIGRSRFTFNDPRELLNMEAIPRCPGRITIMPRSFYGADAAMILDHENHMIHFINCHVLKGFIPKVKTVYSCKIMELQKSEKTYSSKRGKITQAILSSPAGATSLELHQPGVVEFLDLLEREGR